MNTAAARRLAFGDRVEWVGKDGYQPAGLGTITRISAHDLSVSWDGERVMRIGACNFMVFGMQNR